MIEPAHLRPHYHAFLDPSRVLLTGHSHQAWPDVAKQGVLAAFEDAALHVDDKWGRAFEQAQRVREAIAKLVGAAASEIALGQNTHELLVRFVSALPLKDRTRIVTTSGEFHSMYRQLRRLEEEGVEVVFVDARPVASLADRVATAIDERTAAVMCSTVLFETSEVVPNLTQVTEKAHRVGAAVLYDAYHAFSVFPQTVADLGPDPIFVTAGGYKYAQWGEGCCFLRVPPQSEHRPLYTGWFADFASLGDRRGSTQVAYGQAGSERFAGSTYDPVSHYRAARVIEFFEEQSMTIEALRATSLRQTSALIEGLADQELLTPKADDQRAGFVALRVPNAQQIVQTLRKAGVFVDARGEILRFGPAPYLTDDEIARGLDAFREARS